MTAKALTIAAFVLLAIGALVGFIPVSSTGVNCGSAFAKSGDAFSADYNRASMADSAGVRLDSLSATEDACGSLRSLVRIPAIVLLAGGVAVLVAAGVVNGRPRKPASE